MFEDRQALSAEHSQAGNQQGFGWVLAASIFAITIAALYSMSRSADDYTFIYSAEIGRDPHPFYSYAYRFLLHFVGSAIHSVGLTYHGLMPMWVAIFAGGVIALSVAFVKFVGLPARYLPFFIAAFATHGYMTDFYGFPVTYHGYGFAWLFSAAALLALLYLRPLIAIPLAGVCIALGLMSYQSPVLVVLFAGALALVNRWLSGEDGTPYAWKAISAFVLGTGLYFVSIQIFGSASWTRASITASDVLGGLPAYLQTIINVHTRPEIRLVFPQVQQLVYGAAIILLLVAIAVAMVKRGVDKQGVLAICAVIAAVLITPDPFNLLATPFSPSPRSMNATAVFHIGALLVLFRVLETRIPGRIIGILALFFVAMASFSLLSVWARAMQQQIVDKKIAELVIEDIGEITPGTKVVISASWANPAQLPNAYRDTSISAFSPSWARDRYLWLHSPVKYELARVPENACPEPTASWYIVRLEGLVVVCMK